jgi:hypothetical protein
VPSIGSANYGSNIVAIYASDIVTNNSTNRDAFSIANRYAQRSAHGNADGIPDCDTN